MNIIEDLKTSIITSICVAGVFFVASVIAHITENHGHSYIFLGVTALFTVKLFSFTLPKFNEAKKFQFLGEITPFRDDFLNR